MWPRSIVLISAWDVPAFDASLAWLQPRRRRTSRSA
jgi:hypothetical protein